MQADFLKSFLENIEDLRIKIYLETNGVLFKELASVIREVDIIAMDFKLPSSTKSGDFWQSHEEFLSVASQKEVFVKMVICKETEEADIEKAAGIIKNMKPDLEIVLQPNCFDLSSLLLALMESFRDKFLAAGLKRVKILPQAHKYAGIR